MQLLSKTDNVKNNNSLTDMLKSVKDSCFISLLLHAMYFNVKAAICKPCVITSPHISFTPAFQTVFSARYCESSQYLVVYSKVYVLLLTRLRT